MKTSSHWRAWVTVGVLLLLALGTALWLRSDRTSHTAGPGGDASAGPARPDTALVPATEASDLATGAAERASIAPTPSVAEESAAAQPGGADEFRIEVVDAATDSPVAGATVLYVDLGPHASVDAATDVDNLGRVDELLAQHTPIERTTDAAGFARVPRPLGPAVAIARKEGSFGHAGLGAIAKESVRIKIAPDWSLPIQVVDHAGKGVAGVPIALRRHDGNSAYDIVSARTEGPEGVGRVPHAGSCIHRHAQRMAWSAAVAAVLREPLGAEIDPAAPPTVPVRLVLGETGSAVVELVDVDGELCRDAASVVLEAIDAGATSNESTPSARARASGGRARFDFVEVGSDLQAMAFRVHGGPGEVEGRAAGPSKAGETVAVTLRFGVDGPVLQARVVRPSGEPVADRELQIALRAPSFVNVHAIRTGPDGRFRVDLTSEDAARATVGLTVWDRSSGDATPGIDLPVGLGPGLHELGDFVLGAAPLVAGGIVVDTTGQPVPRAHVLVHVRTPLDESSAQSFRWEQLFTSVAISAADGRFALRGSVDAASPVYISARREGFVPGGAECRLGTDGLELVLGKGGSIVGRVEADAGTPFDRIAVGVDSPAVPTAGTPPPLWFQRHRWLDAGGRFALRDVPAGVYSISVRETRTDTLFLEIPGVAVASGETCPDPRVAVIDLRGRVGGIALRIVDPDGRRVPRGMVWVRMPDGKSPRAEWFTEGEARLLRLEPTIDLIVEANGFRNATIEGVSGDREVVLERGLPVRLVLTNPSSRPDPPLYLSAVLEAVADGFDQPGWWGSEFDERGELALLSPAAGRLEVKWILQRRTSSGDGSCELECKTPTVIEVVDAPGEQIFEVSFDADALAEGLKELDG